MLACMLPPIRCRGNRSSTCETHFPKAAIVASQHWNHSSFFLNGCMAAVDVHAQLGFHFLFFCSSWGLSAGQAPSVVMSKAPTRLTPFMSKHVCANKSSPIGPYLPFLIPTFQLISGDALHMSMFATKVVKAALLKTSRLPK